MALTENGEAAKSRKSVTVREMRSRKGKHVLPVCVTSMTGCTGKEPTPTPTEAAGRTEGKGGNPGVVLLSPLCPAWWRRSVLLL